mmetsp:Transcript_167382/g.296374  ORF Transcript_167382/g.296374 Transcript_167382/m.296374 type:complete len:107 (-) Transcript_167382:1511-1831(-)
MIEFQQKQLHCCSCSPVDIQAITRDKESHGLSLRAVLKRLGFSQSYCSAPGLCAFEPMCCQNKKRRSRGPSVMYDRPDIRRQAQAPIIKLLCTTALIYGCTMELKA